MKLAKATILTASLLVLLITPALYAGPGCCGGGPGFGPMGRGGAFLGDLSKEQQQQADALRLDLFKKQQAFQNELSKKQIELMELAAKTNPDEQTLQAKREEMWKLQDQMRNERRAFQTKLMGLLTPEQRSKIGAFGPGGGCPMGMGGFGCGRGAGGWQGAARNL